MGTHQWNALGDVALGNSGSDGSCKGETQVVRTLGESKQVMYLPA